FSILFNFQNGSSSSGSLFILCHSSVIAFQLTFFSCCVVHTFQKSGSLDFGRCSGLSSFISTKIGIGDAHPNSIAFLVGNIGSSCSNPPILSGTSLLTSSWSLSFTIRCRRNVLH